MRDAIRRQHKIAIRYEETQGKASERVIWPVTIVHFDDVRRFTTDALLELDYGVAEAVDGASAIAVLDSAQMIDLVLTDVVLMGSLTGRDVADHAERVRPGTPILFATGYARDPRQQGIGIANETWQSGHADPLPCGGDLGVGVRRPEWNPCCTRLALVGPVRDALIVDDDGADGLWRARTPRSQAIARHINAREPRRPFSGRED